MVCDIGSRILQGL